MPRREIASWLMDMDGVLVHEEAAIPGADHFIARLVELGLPFLVLTNNSIYTRRDLAARLRASGLEVPEDAIWTSALATARFLESQRPGGTAFVIGEAGLTTALHEAGYTLSERDPEYVILGETRTYSFERITRAIRLIHGGSRFIATNPDPTAAAAISSRGMGIGTSLFLIAGGDPQVRGDCARGGRQRHPAGLVLMVEGVSLSLVAKIPGRGCASGPCRWSSSPRGCSSLREVLDRSRPPDVEPLGEVDAVVP